MLLSNFAKVSNMHNIHQTLDSTVHVLNDNCNIFIGCKTFFPLMYYDEKPEASKCGTCRRRGRDNYHNKKKLRSHDTNATNADVNVKVDVQAGIDVGVANKNSGELSPHAFCSFANTMTQEDDEVIDVQTLLEYAAFEYDGRTIEDTTVSGETEQMYMPMDVTDTGNVEYSSGNVNHFDISESDEDREMAELFTSTWLPGGEGSSF